VYDACQRINARSPQIDIPLPATAFPHATRHSRFLQFSAQFPYRRFFQRFYLIRIVAKEIVEIKRAKLAGCQCLVNFLEKRIRFAVEEILVGKKH